MNSYIVVQEGAPAMGQREEEQGGVHGAALPLECPMLPLHGAFPSSQ